MTQNGNHIVAAEGKVFRRIASGELFGNEMFLGYSYYIGGVRQDPPHLDTAADFEEVDDTSAEELTAQEALNIITGQDNE